MNYGIHEKILILYIRLKIQYLYLHFFESYQLNKNRYFLVFVYPLLVIIHKISEQL